MIVEICANSFESAWNAEKAGATRIELCTELSVGGLTPSYGLLKKVMAHITIPVHVLIRPRSGNFTYSQSELDIMLADIEFCKSIGCAGIVSGILTSDQEIDVAHTRKLISASGDMEFTFHRAFDWCPDPIVALQLLKTLLVDRLLSSGQQTSAAKGLPLLIELKRLAENQLQIMPGGGITIANCVQFKLEGFDMIHLSASQKTQSLIDPPKVAMQSSKHFEEGVITTSNRKLIEEVIKKLAD